MATTSPLEFIRQVRQEAAKVSWPSQKELAVSTAMVFVMVFVASLFFLGVDWVLGFFVSFILGLAA